jgi:hypothetical protein
VEKYTDLVLVRNGQSLLPQPGASVTVLTSPAGLVATIYSDNGITEVANPLTTDGNGRFSFYAADGRYSLTVTYGTVTYSVLDFPLEFDPFASGAGGFVPASALASASGATLVGTSDGYGNVQTSLSARAINAKPSSSTSNYINQFLDQNGTGNGQLIGIDIEQALNQSGTIAAYQFGQTTELFTLSANNATWNGQLTSVYGSCNHFGSGNSTFLAGGGFEGFNDGPGTATQVVGVSGNAYNGGVAAGNPQQTPTNNGAALNLRGVAGHAINLSSGVVGSAVALYAYTPTNTGGGSITTAYGLFIGDQLAGATNYAIFTGHGLNNLGDVLQVTGQGALPAATNQNAFTVAGGASGVNGTLYVGDGTGRSLNFSKRTGGVDSVLAQFFDSGTFRLAANVQISAPTKTHGYSTGAGGAVTQLTSKATGVTLNTSAGVITTNNAALAAGAEVSFNFTNSNFNSTAIMVHSVAAGTSTTGAYVITVDNMQGGVCSVCIRNLTAGSLSEAIIINFAVIQASAN